MKLAILDLDGTLLDSKQRHIAVLNFVLEAYNSNRNLAENIDILSDKLVNYSFEDITSLTKAGNEGFVTYKCNGYSTLDYLSDMLSINIDDAKNISKLWVAFIENDKFLALDSFYDDAYSFLLELKEKGFINIILTARQNDSFIKESINSSVEREYIDDIEVVIPRDASIHKKEYIEGIMNDYDSVILIGDTEVDYNAAKELNVMSYILNSGFRSKEFFDKLDVKTYSSLKEIISALAY